MLENKLSRAGGGGLGGWGWVRVGVGGGDQMKIRLTQPSLTGNWDLG